MRQLLRIKITGCHGFSIFSSIFEDYIHIYNLVYCDEVQKDEVFSSMSMF